ncbi:enoyl-CoA hydratase domain-containing protein 2, mitochondrial isoform X2 [Pungitius pungitius]|uniref:enoyl-CoA hydratase domain-containing protein 2, mitochondrial isoform X2 n=1 Tax=Pungitius pungitius TaxID=134920 RepID=UPI002E0E0723
MATLLRRLAAPSCSSRPWTHVRASAPIPRGGAPLLPGEGVPPPACGGAQSRRKHAEASPPEVDLRRLEGEDDGIVEVLMCRHKARNALGHVFLSQMMNLVSSLANDSAHVVVFRSLVPGVFCAGADLKERVLMNHAESDRFVHRLRSLMTQIAHSAQMGLIETTRGLLPGAGGSQRLPRTVGLSLAKELIFTGRRIGGQAALGIGLVNRAIEQNQSGDAAYREALVLAREILPQAPIAVRLSKEAMNRGIEVDMSSAMAIERMCYSRVIPTRDRQEGMAAFLEKRPPRYTGE